MNLSFFLTVFWVACPTQAQATQANVAPTGIPLAEQLADAQRKIETFRSAWAVNARDRLPNEKLMTLESVVTELELDFLGKKALWDLLQVRSPETMPETPELRTELAADPQLLSLAESLRSLEEDLQISRTVGVVDPGRVSQLEHQIAVARTKVDEETAVKTLAFNNRTISQAQQSFLKSQEMLCKAQDQLALVKSEQRERDAILAKYLRLIENRDNLRIRMQEEQAAEQLSGLRGMTLTELMAAVNRSQAALERAQRIHQHTVNTLLEAVRRSAQPGANERLTQPDSAPAGE